MVKSLVLTFIFLLCSCATLKKEQEQLHFSSLAGKNEQSLQILKKEEYQKKENRLLFLIETAIVKDKQGFSKEALEVLRETDELFLSLYTKSIREAIMAGIFSDNEKSFYGKVYERSSIFDLQIRIMLKLYSGAITKTKDSKGNEKELKLNEKARKDYLKKARAVVIAWNSFYEDLSRSDGKYFLVQDYHQKLLSALIHEEIGRRNDKNIAFILYEQLYKKLDSYMAFYPSFNTNYKKDLQSYLKRKKVKTKKTSPELKKLKDYIERSILRLSKKINRKKYLKYKKKFKLKDLKTKGVRVSFLFSNSLVDLMQTKNIAYNLANAFSGIKDPVARSFVTTVGASALTYFAFGTLGLSRYYVSKGDGYIIYDNRLNNKLAQNIGIEVKVPFLPELQTVVHPALRIKKKTSIIEKSGALIFNSYREKMYLSTQEYSNNYFKEKAVSIGIKYILAIIAAYKTYQHLDKNNNPLASTLAMSQFFLTSKAILASQVVDTRHIVGLSAYDYFHQTHLEVGEYELEVVDGTDPEKVLLTKKFSVSKKGPKVFSL